MTDLQKINECGIEIEAEQQRHDAHIQLVGTTNVNFEKFQHDTIKPFDRVDCSLRLVESNLDLILRKSNEHERDINQLKQ